MDKPAVEISTLPKVYDFRVDEMRDATLQDFERGQSAIACFGLFKEAHEAIHTILRLTTLGTISWARACDIVNGLKDEARRR